MAPVERVLCAAAVLATAMGWQMMVAAPRPAAGAPVHNAPL